MRQKLRIVLLVSAVWAGCNDSTVSVGNENPLGTVGGIILDAVNEMPIGGAMVKLVSASAVINASTAMDGSFQLPKVPSGTFILSISQMGFETATFNANLIGAVGNFPVKNPSLTIGPIGLVRNDGTFSVRVVDQTGAPAPMIKATLHTNVRYVDFSFGGPQAIGSYELSGVSGPDGVIAFTGVPNYAALGSQVSDFITIQVPPTQLMGMNGYSFLGLDVNFNANHIDTSQSTPTIVLAGPRTPLVVLQSSIDYIRTGAVGSTGSVIPTGGPITVTYNQAINPTSVRASFVNEDGKPSSQTASATVSVNVLTITPSMPFTPGARYNLQLHVDADASVLSGSEQNILAPFFVQSSGAIMVLLSPDSVKPHLDPAAVGTSTLVFQLSEPIGFGRGMPAGGGISCVAFYQSANFDNANGPFPGNWTVIPPGGGSAQSGVPGLLACTPPPGESVALDVTRITPLPEFGVVTGFSSRWSVEYDATGSAGCAIAGSPPMPIVCQRPMNGAPQTNIIHLVFSKLDSSSTVRRVTGQPVDDKIAVPIP